MLRSSLVAAMVAVFASSSHALTKPEIQAKACEGMLGLTMTSVAEDGIPQFERMAGIGLRGFLGAYPKPSPKLTQAIAGNGVMYWAQGMAVRKTLEEAQKHDAKFQGLSKLIYLISDVDVSDINEKTRKRVVQARFRTVMANARIVYWDDSEKMVNGTDVPPVLVEVDLEAARRLMVPETIGYFVNDDRGPRFYQGGWAFPKIRGELRYSNTFETNSKTTKNTLAFARKISKEGYTITFNQNFQESLNRARDQVRIEKNKEGKWVAQKPNSRYLLDPNVYKMALEGYAAGHAFSVEVRDPQGKLKAGILGERRGNLVSLDTVFYDVQLSDEKDPKGLFYVLRTDFDMAKVAAFGAEIRLNESGITWADSGMVSNFSATIKAKYFFGEDFANDVDAIQALPYMHIDFTKPWIP